LEAGFTGGGIFFRIGSHANFADETIGPDIVFLDYMPEKLLRYFPFEAVSKG
jgi:hypothetical protein